MARRLVVPALVALAVLTVPATALATTSDLATTFTVNTSSVPEEGNWTYTLVVTNHGPDPASNAHAAFAVPTAKASFQTATISQGSGTISGTGDVSLNFGTIANGSTATATLTYRGDHPGTVHTTATNSFSPVAGQSDPQPDNDSVSTDVTIVGLTASPAAFADQALGTMSPAKLVTLTNQSAQSVTLGALAPSGAGASDFFSFLDGCSGAVVPSAGSCTFTLRFAPGDLGPRAETLTATPNGGPVDPLAIAVSGSGIPLPVNTGPTGATGPQGPAGLPAFKLVLAPAVGALKAKSGRSVVIGYASTLAARVVLDVLKGKKTVATVKSRARQGANRINWNGKVRRKPAAAGRYALRLTATAGGQTTRITTPLKLVR